MDWLAPIINALKSLVINFGAFLAGKAAQKNDDNKKNLDIEKKRDKIDAEPSPNPSDILDSMRNGEL
jgi:hypothetical protein